MDTGPSQQAARTGPLWTNTKAGPARSDSAAVGDAKKRSAPASAEAPLSRAPPQTQSASLREMAGLELVPIRRRDKIIEGDPPKKKHKGWAFVPVDEEDQPVGSLDQPPALPVDVKERQDRQKRRLFGIDGRLATSYQQGKKIMSESASDASRDRSRPTSPENPLRSASTAPTFNIMHNRRQSLPAAPNGLSNGAVTSSVPPSTSAAGPPPPATPPSPPVSIWVPIMSTLKKFRLEDRSSCRCIYETNGRTQRRCRCNKEGKRISEVPIRVERVSLPSEKPVFRLIELPDEIAAADHPVAQAAPSQRLPSSAVTNVDATQSTSSTTDSMDINAALSQTRAPASDAPASESSLLKPGHPTLAATTPRPSRAAPAPISKLPLQRASSQLAERGGVAPQSERELSFSSARSSLSREQSGAASLSRSTNELVGAPLADRKEDDDDQPLAFRLRDKGKGRMIVLPEPEPGRQRRPCGECFARGLECDGEPYLACSACETAQTPCSHVVCARCLDKKRDCKRSSYGEACSPCGQWRLVCLLRIIPGCAACVEHGKTCVQRPGEPCSRCKQRRKPCSLVDGPLEAAAASRANLLDPSITSIHDSSTSPVDNDPVSTSVEDPRPRFKVEDEVIAEAQRQAMHLGMLWGAGFSRPEDLRRPEGVLVSKFDPEPPRKALVPSAFRRQQLEIEGLRKGVRRQRDQLHQSEEKLRARLKELGLPSVEEEGAAKEKDQLPLLVPPADANAGKIAELQAFAEMQKTTIRRLESRIANMDIRVQHAAEGPAIRAAGMEIADLKKKLLEKTQAEWRTTEQLEYERTERRRLESEAQQWNGLQAHPADHETLVTITAEQEKALVNWGHKFNQTNVALETCQKKLKIERDSRSWLARAILEKQRHLVNAQTTIATLNTENSKLKESLLSSMKPGLQALRNLELATVDREHNLVEALLEVPKAQQARDEANKKLQKTKNEYDGASQIMNEDCRMVSAEAEDLEKQLVQQKGKLVAPPPQITKSNPPPQPPSNRASETSTETVANILDIVKKSASVLSQLSGVSITAILAMQLPAFLDLCSTLLQEAEQEIKQLREEKIQRSAEIDTLRKAKEQSEAQAPAKSDAVKSPTAEVSARLGVTLL